MSTEIGIERWGIRGYECSGCRRRTWRVRDLAERIWEDLPWAEQWVTLVYSNDVSVVGQAALAPSG
jgi:hypothetical protein